MRIYISILCALFLCNQSLAAKDAEYEKERAHFLSRVASLPTKKHQFGETNPVHLISGKDGAIVAVQKRRPSEISKAEAAVYKLSRLFGLNNVAECYQGDDGFLYEEYVKAGDVKAVNPAWTAAPQRGSLTLHMLAVWIKNNTADETGQTLSTYPQFFDSSSLHKTPLLALIAGLQDMSGRNLALRTTKDGTFEVVSFDTEHSFNSNRVTYWTHFMGGELAKSPLPKDIRSLILGWDLPALKEATKSIYMDNFNGPTETRNTKFAGRFRMLHILQNMVAVHPTMCMGAIHDALSILGFVDYQVSPPESLGFPMGSQNITGLLAKIWAEDFGEMGSIYNTYMASPGHKDYPTLRGILDWFIKRKGPKEVTTPEELLKRTIWWDVAFKAKDSEAKSVSGGGGGGGGGAA